MAAKRYSTCEQYYLEESRKHEHGNEMQRNSQKPMDCLDFFSPSESQLDQTLLEK